MRAALVAAVLVSVCQCGKPSGAPRAPEAAEVGRPAGARSDAVSRPRDNPPTESEDKMANLVLALDVPRSLDNGDTFLMSSFTVEEIEASPEDPDSYPSGSGVVVTVRAGDADVELSRLSAPYGSTSVAWTDRYRIELVDLDDSRPSVALRVTRVEDELVSGWEQHVRIARGQVVALPDGTAVRFDGHSHKMVEPGMRSPLIVSMTLEREGEGKEERTWNVDVPDDPRWDWRDLVFVLEAYEYGESMALSIRRRRLTPVATAQP